MISMLLTLVLAAPLEEESGFEQHFTGKTMRFDYYHSGTASEEHVSLDEVRVEGDWPGSRVHLVDPLDVAKYRLVVSDADTDATLFTRGFASIYGEWETTGEARKGIWRTFHETQRFPEPRAPVRVTVNGYTYRSSLATVSGTTKVGVSAEVREATGVQAGDVVDVEMVLDTAPREVEVPPDFAAALAGEPAAQATFDRQADLYDDGLLAADGQIMAAECRFRRQAFADALPRFTAAVARRQATDALRAMALVHAAHAAGELGQWTQSRDLAVEALHCYPTSEWANEARCELGAAQLELGQIGAAERELTTAFQQAKPPLSLRAEFSLARVQLATLAKHKLGIPAGVDNRIQRGELVAGAGHSHVRLENRLQPQVIARAIEDVHPRRGDHGIELILGKPLRGPRSI